MATFTDQMRQGLPRTPGGDPWPPTGVMAAPRDAEQAVVESRVEVAEAPAPAVEATAIVSAVEAVATEAAVTGAAATETVEVSLRQGLPRTPGGDAWPPAGAVKVERAVATDVAPAPVAVPVVEAVPVVDTAPAVEPVESPAHASAPTEPPTQVAEHAQVTEPKPVAEATQAKQPKATREPRLIRGRTVGSWVGLASLWGGAAILVAGIIVLAARGVTTLPGVPEFMDRYPGEYKPLVPVDEGFPVWARWAHFFNFFLMVLIIRSGLLVRHQQRPDAFYTPKKGGKKISIYLWLHTSIDLLWLLNGVAFVVLLFASGHWARIVPTNWEVFPNALSAGLQYLTLEWPVEDGWVNYNSLQQLMYFTVIFIAAPLAVITGVRMSEWWPENAEKLNKLYPAPVARAIHYPVMLFFTLFILVHVFLVFTTGALKNLNHMFAGTPEISWTGFWWFAAGLLVTAVVTWLARPLVLAPIANIFGRVSER